MEGLPNKSSISQYLPIISADEDPQGHTKAEAPSYRDLNIRIDSLIVRTENIDEYGFTGCPKKNALSELCRTVRVRRHHLSRRVEEAD